MRGVTQDLGGWVSTYLLSPNPGKLRRPLSLFSRILDKASSMRETDSASPGASFPLATARVSRSNAR